MQKIEERIEQQRSETETYVQLYLSDPVPLRLYGVIKAHKPEKCYPMQAVVSLIGTPPFSWYFSISGRIDSTLCK